MSAPVPATTLNVPGAGPAIEAALPTPAAPPAKTEAPKATDTKPAVVTEQKNETGTPATNKTEKLPGITVTGEIKDLSKLNEPGAITHALKEASQTMLKLKDPDLLLIAQANACGDTPMGLEFKYGVLHRIRHMSVREHPVLERLPLALLHHQLDVLKFPEKPPTAAFEKFLTDNKDKLPPGFNLPRTALELNTGKMRATDLVNQFQGDEKFKALQEPFLQALMGDKPKDIASMLKGDMTSILLGVDIDPKKNWKAISEIIYGKIGQRGGFDKMLAFGFVAMFMQYVTQLLSEERGNRAPAQSAG